ncbi:MAG: serine/threonine protein kinase [Chloroflexi bacterium]|nr:MAG: serine/threonine protein kinase [Chloroflexota bacterium]
MNNDETWEGKQINQYDVQEYLTRGGMADIYRASDSQLKRVVCLKVMQADYLNDEAFVKRFQREARTAASLDHPDIIKIFDTGMTPSGQPFIVMEYIEDGSLDRLTAKGEISWPLPQQQALKLIKRVASALFTAHNRRIFHRDLKPQNILMRHKKHPVLTDFGVAAVEEMTKLTRTGEMPGTPYYMSPEQIRGERVDGRSDIYALGLILYEMLAGSHPYAHLDPWRILEHQVLIEPPPLRLARDGLSDATYQVVNTCLQKHAANRYQSVIDLIKAIDMALERESAGDAPPPPTSIPRPGRWQLYFRQNWLLLLLIGLVLILLTLSIINILPNGIFGETGLTQNAIKVAATAVSTNTPNPTSPATIQIVVQASPTLIPVTPTYTHTPLPTETPVLPTETAVPPTAPPIINPIQPPRTTPTLSCVARADSSWGNTVDQYESRLGCATSGIITYQMSEAAYQMFPGGQMIWRANTNQIHVLYNDATLSTFNVGPADASQATCQNNLQNSFGWLWCTNSVVQSLGIPSETERNANNMIVQQFENGLLLTYSEINNNLVLFTKQKRWETSPK